MAGLPPVEAMRGAVDAPLEVQVRLTDAQGHAAEAFASVVPAEPEHGFSRDCE